MVRKRRLHMVNKLITSGRVLSFLLVWLASGTLSSQEFPYDLTERQPNTTLLLDRPGYAIREMELERVFTDVVYNVLCQRMRTIVTRRGTVSTHKAQWDGLRDGGQAAASSLYFYRLEHGERTQVGPMMLLR